MAKFSKNLNRVKESFDRDALARVCILPEDRFGVEYDMERTRITTRKPGEDDFYFFKDNGASVLAVAHLDTVGLAHQRAAHFIETEAGPVVYSRALDDRLGAYIILELLPALGIQYDILLTVGEESGQSTAEFFDMPPGKDYNYMIEFDRGGTDVVMYQYDDAATRQAVRACGARVGDGIFSDISYMEHLEIKGFNWGVGYRDYHGPRAHAYLNDTFDMVARYLKFHQTNADVWMPHEPAPSWHGSRSSTGNWWNEDDERDADMWDNENFDTDGRYVEPDDSYTEGVYFDVEYNEDPTIEEIQAALEAADEERYALIEEGWDEDVEEERAS